MKIRYYRESDASCVGRLIADTYRTFNLGFADPMQTEQLLGPFARARSRRKADREAIADAIRAETVLVAQDGHRIAGVLRGRREKLQSLFVAECYQRRGAGRRLVREYEQICLQQGGRVIKLMSTLYAVPFYQAMGYRKTTGVRSMGTFSGNGLPYQPMKKVLRR